MPLACMTRSTTVVTQDGHVFSFESSHAGYFFLRYWGYEMTRDKGGIMMASGRQARMVWTGWVHGVDWIHCLAVAQSLQSVRCTYHPLSYPGTMKEEKYKIIAY